MADEMKKKVDEASVDAALEADCETVDSLESMRAAIADLQEKETVLTEKLFLAKEKGLAEQAARCRDLLQKVVRQRQKKQEELRQEEARQLAAELDAITEEIRAEVDPDVPSEEEIECYNYLAKSRRLSFISKMVGFVGIFACFLGAFVYLLLAQVETINLPFEWMHLVVVGVVAVLFLVIALILGGASNKYKQIAELIEAELAEEQEMLDLLAKEEAFTTESLDSATEAYEIEKELELKRATPETEKRFALKLPQVPEKVKKNVHKIVPVAAACTAIAAIFAVSSASKKIAAEKRSAAARRDFFNWLG